MSYRGAGLTYKIRKTTTQNKTGDNYSITVPSYVAQMFENCLFKLTISGNAMTFESGCKLSALDIEKQSKKVFVGGTSVSFK